MGLTVPDLWPCIAILCSDMPAFTSESCIKQAMYTAGEDHLGQCASDDHLLDTLLGTWQGVSPERSNPSSNKQQQEARLAAWKARADTATQRQPASQPTNDDVIVLD